MIEFSIVIVAWNSGAELGELLPTIERHHPAGVETIVVDNASTDDTAAVVEQTGATLIRRADNRGFGAASNAGVATARGDVVVLLNPDTLLVDSSLERLAEMARTTGALCGPELLNPDGSRQPSASALPAGWEVAATAVIPSRAFPNRIRERCEPWRAARVVEVGWLTGACIAAPRSVLLELGPFDESIELYGEDVDLGVRARRIGFRSLFAPDVARIVHLGGRSAGQRFADAGARRKLVSRRAIVRRHFGRRRERYDFACQVAFHASRYVAKRLLGRRSIPERTWLRALTRW